MEQNSILERLSLFGMTRQEANIYVCIYQNGEITGYEVAKLTGISRSNVYSTLSALVEMGAVYLIEGNTSKYVAVPIEELCENKIRQLQDEKQYLITHLTAEKKQEIGYVTITGYKNIKDKIKHMLQQAQLRIYFSASVELLNELEEELLELKTRISKIVLITDGEIRNEILKNKCIYYIGEKKEKNVRLIIDSEYALTGVLNGQKDDTCLYTGQENFIQIFKDALRNEIRLIEITEGEKNNE